MDNNAHEVMWRRMRYMLTPQWDIYISLRGKFRGKKVLEVGFGTGAGVLQYCYNARFVDAIDPDPGAVDFAQKTFPMNNVKWAVGDITNYKTTQKYDVVVMIETLEHIPEWRKSLENICELLVGGGYLVISSRNKNADLRRWKDLHEREWTAQEFSHALKGYFQEVILYDYSLTNIQSESTRMTPLVAIAKRTQKILRWMP
jgi:2-polyprenyl-3-methyl-5-hydroxy-6-metoxy-1,4-benzoquinol methylase